MTSDVVDIVAGGGQGRTDGRRRRRNGDIRIFLLLPDSSSGLFAFDS
jgi:hypothetical protein